MNASDRFPGLKYIDPSSWPNGYGASGIPHPGYGNTLEALDELQIVLPGGNINGLGDGLDGPVTGASLAIIRHEIYSQYGFYPTKSHVRDAIAGLGRDLETGAS